MNEPKTYNATDIERYHSGQLSAAERHALEKAALDDPFLADALEGYVFTKTPSADNDFLQQRLQLRIEKERKNNGVFQLNNWLKIAAMLVLMAGGGWLVFQLSGDKEQAVATKPSPAAVPPAQKGDTVLDSATPFSDAPLATQAQTVEIQKEQTEFRATQDNLVVGKTPGASSVQAPPAAMLNKQLADSPKIESYAKLDAEETLKSRASGVAVNKAASEAIALSEEKKDATAFKKPAAAPADKNSRFAPPATDTVRNVNVTLRRSELPADQTVVLKGRAKETPLAKRMTVTLDSLEPVEGWTRFDDYVSNNIKEPEELKERQLSGAVELSFDVNREGEPVNISVTKSLCNKCDEEAVRLLKEGPKWKQKKKKGKVKIKFPLAP